MSSHGKFAVEFVTTKMTMQRLVETLGPAAGRPVFDTTGLAAGANPKTYTHAMFLILLHSEDCTGIWRRQNINI